MYSCKNCKYASSTKLWKCPDCDSFWTFIEDSALDKKLKMKSKHIISKWKVLTQREFKTNSSYFLLRNKEFLRVFTDGVKMWGMYLLGWAPWIGKSTLVLQIVEDIILNNNIKIWYFTGEEQETQVFARRERIREWTKSKDINLQDNMHLFHTTHLEDIISTTEEYGFDLIIIDSVQTIYSVETDSAAGSANQVKYCSEKLSEFCKQSWITSFIIWHVTKWGEIAGPKYLEHIVDVVMYLEWDRFGQLRFLRNQKNRFGHTDDSWIFEMTLFGLQPVYDLKDRILQSANTTIPGSVFTIWLDNWRPVLTTIEVLLNKTNYKFPQKNCIGVSTKRVDLVLAILERYLKLNLSLFDIFVNVPGEFSFIDSWLDLAIAVGIYSQYSNKVVDKQNVFIWELWLGGQVVKTKLHNKRTREVPDSFQVVDLNVLKNIIELKQWI